MGGKGQSLILHLLSLILASGRVRRARLRGRRRRRESQRSKSRRSKVFRWGNSDSSTFDFRPILLGGRSGVELAEEGSQAEGFAGGGVFFDRQGDAEAGRTGGVAAGGESLSQAAGAGEEVEDGEGHEG